MAATTLSRQPIPYQVPPTARRIEWFNHSGSQNSCLAVRIPYRQVPCGRRTLFVEEAAMNTNTDRMRQVSWEDPLVTARGAAGLTGYAFLKAILEGTIPPAPIQATLGFDLIAVEEGLVRFCAVPAEHLYNPMNGVHGGVACTLLDSAMGSAVMTTLDAKTGYSTLDLAVHLTRPISAKTGPIVAEGRVVHRGGRIATAEGRLTDGDGRLLAHATTTCILLER
jgi:uncharacterized protein (TIGR00369 family)